MVTEIRMAATVGDDRRLDVQLPAGAPTGPVEVIVRAAAVPASEAAAPGSAARTAARAKMAAAGFLSEAHRPPAGARALSVDERVRAGALLPGSRPSEELVAEARGDY
jgi:hypothetical protein